MFFTELAKGEYSLGKSFWKYGVFGLLIGYIGLYIIERILYAQIGGVDLLTFYFRRAGFMTADVKILIFTCLHILSLVLYLIYSIRVFLGVWRSSKEYEKSSILALLARIFIFIIIVFGLRCAF